MNLSQCKEEYYYFSGKISEINRQLSLAGIAVIWIFYNSDKVCQTEIKDLVLAGIFIISSLSLDFLQYLYGTIAWGICHRKKEKEIKDPEKQFRVSRYINWPTNTFFYSKLACTFISYKIIIIFLVNKFILAS